MALGGVVGQSAGEAGELCGVQHPDRDGGAVTPAVPLGVLNRVAECMAVVEDLAKACLAEVVGHDLGLHVDRELDGATELLGRGVHSASRVCFDDVEDLRRPDEPGLHDLGEARRRLVRAEAGELVEVADHRTRRPEGTDEVLALRRVHPGLASDGGVDESEHRGRHLDELHAAEPGGRHETGEVGDRAAAVSDDRVAACEISLTHDLPAEGRDFDALALLRIRDLGEQHIARPV